MRLIQYQFVPFQSHTSSHTYHLWQNNSSNSLLLQSKNSIDHLSPPKKRKIIHSLDVTKQYPQLNDKHYFPYHSSQRDIINIIEQYSNTNVITKFHFRNKWFDGCYVTINHKNILAHTIGTDDIQTYSEYFNQQQIYTSIVSHNHNIWSVCSSSKNIYKHGF